MWQLCFDIDQHVPEDFGHWLAGFIDGEGCFRIRLRNRNGYWQACAELKISLRADDKEILNQIKDILRTGTIIYQKARPAPGKMNSKPQVIWSVTKINDIVRIIIPLFEKCQLRAKKRGDFEIWSKAARLIHSKAHHTKQGRNLLRQLMTELSNIRTFQDQPVGPDTVRQGKEYYQRGDCEAQ